jgi:hypothetical protein
VREEEEEEEEMGEPSGHTYLDARYLLYYIYPSSYIYSSIEYPSLPSRGGGVWVVLKAGRINSETKKPRE